MWSKINSEKKVASKVDKNPLTSVSAIDSAFIIDEEYHQIIITLLYKPDLNKTKIFEELLYEMKQKVGSSFEMSLRERDNMYAKIKRQVDDLSNLELIISPKKEKIGNFSDKTSSKLFRLSLIGIFYVLLNWNRISFESSVLNALNKNYPDNLLFENFLYQYIEKQSIGEIGALISHQIVSYLSNICKHIVNHLHMLRTPGDFGTDQFQPSTLFSWPRQNNITKGEFSSQEESNLKNYLYKELTWKWIHDATIIPDFVGNKITIKSTEVDFTPVIEIFRKEKQAILKIGTRSIMFLGIERQSNGSLNIIGKPLLTHTSFRNHSFNKLCKEEVLLLIYRIYKINDFPDYDQSFVEDIVHRTLINDSMFKKTVDTIRNTFEFKESIKA
jgi:hypothetical protein